MALRYIGGGFIRGVLRRDMTDADIAAMPDGLRSVTLRSPFYAECGDADVRALRRDWVVSRDRKLRVLVFCPTYRLEPETVTAIFAQGYDGPTDFYFTRDNPYAQEIQRGYHNIWHNLEKARAHMLRANYDAMMVVESDVIPPADALTKLLRLDADIAGGWYVMRHGDPVANAFVYVPGQDDPGTYYTDAEIEDAGGVMRANGVCMGCVLIHRHVLERVPFRMHEAAAPDWAWMTDCNRAGFVTVFDPSIRCGHKRPDGEILWPTSP